MTQTEITTTWREHFRVLEGGLDSSPAELLDLCRQSQARFEGSDTVDAAHMPTWLGLEAALRHTAGRKAAGPDLLPPMLCKRFSPQLTTPLWPLLLKTVCVAAEAAGLKGGTLHHIGKPNPKSPHTCDAHRGILVQSAVAKAFHRSLRGLVVQHWQKTALPLQIGGRSGCSASFGHLCSRAMLHFARRTGLSAALIFIDLSAAYYAVIRETLFGKDLSSRPVHEIAEALGLDRDDLQALTHLVENEAILQQQDAPVLMRELAQEFHQQTWFVLHGDTHLISTFRGTRPGGTLADIMFNLLFGQALRRRKSSSLRSAVPSVPWSGHRSPFPRHSEGSSSAKDIPDIVYADDLCIPVVCDKASNLRSVVSAVAADTFDTLTPHALRVNLGPTKTAAIMAHTGAGSRAARHESFGVLKGRAPILPEGKGLMWLDLVARYRHLGAVVAYDGSLRADVKHRLALARNAFRDGRRRLFACKDVPLSRRAIFFKTHVLSTLTAGIGSWPALGECDWILFSGGLLGLYRQLMGLRAQGHWNLTVSQILASTGLPAADTILHTERLRFLSQLVRHGPDELWALLGWYTDYQRAVRAAGAWLLQTGGSAATLGPIEHNWERWASLMRDSPGKWKGLLKRAEAWYGCRHDLQARFDYIVRQVWEPLAPASPSDLSDLQHGCLICGLAFASRQQWGAHSQRVHGYRHPATRLATGRQCRACGSLYATQGRLRCHLLASRRCLQFLESQDSPEGATMPGSGHLQAPAVQGWGCAHLPPVEEEFCRPLRLALQSTVFNSDQEIYDEVVSHIAPLPVLRHTVTGWMRELQNDGIRQMAADVLLVLTPEHLCTRLAGKQLEVLAPVQSFSPCLRCPLLRCPAPAAHALHFGMVDTTWRQRWKLEGVPLVPMTLADIPFSALRCYAVSVDFPAPPDDHFPLLSPALGSLKAMRKYCAWASDLLRVFCCLFRTALSGRPSRLRVPLSSHHFEPLTSWASQAAAQLGNAGLSCFTLEFNMQ